MKTKSIYKNYEMSLVLLIAALFMTFSFLSPYFLKAGNMIQLLTQFVELGLLTIGMSITIISGGFDLSIGTMTSMLTVILATLMGTLGIPVWAAILIAVSIAAICGALNGYICGYLKVAPMLTTLGTMSLFTGIGMVISKGNTVSCLVPEYYIFGQGKLFGIIPVQFLILLVAATIAVILFNKSRWGRKVYMIGSCPEAARFSGINCERNTLLVYVFSAMMAFLCAIVLSSRMCSGRADVGDPMVLQSVSAAVFGGISIKGGTGNILGALCGVIIFSIISNGLNLINVSVFMQQIIMGIMLLGVLSIRTLVHRR